LKISARLIFDAGATEDYA